MAGGNHRPVGFEIRVRLGPFFCDYLIYEDALPLVKCFRDSSFLKDLVQEEEQELFEGVAGMLQ